MLTNDDICACLVTRGDVDMGPILQSLPYNEIVIWNNALGEDKKTAGRYFAIEMTKRPVIYFQDDDTVFHHHRELVDAYEGGVPTAVYGHGATPDGYDDLPLVCGGALVPREMPWVALNRYLEVWPEDDGFLYEADFIAGVLYPYFKHVHLPFYIDLAIAQAPNRLCNQRFQKDLKLEITNRAREIRDEARVAA